MKRYITLLVLIGSVGLGAPFTKTQVDNMMDRNLSPFRQDVTGSNTISIASADTEYRFAVDGAARNEVQAPTYMTNRWDTANNKMTATTEYDHPVYVADVGFVWVPDTPAPGLATLRIWIDDDTPKLIRTYVGDYGGDASVPFNILATWYWGDETGYDAKNDGIYFTVEFENTGDVTSPSLVIYNTQ